MKRFDASALDRLLREAAASPRRRLNLNWHEPAADTVQRFFNLMLPGSYVRPHRHQRQNRWELTVLLSGAVDLLGFDDDGLLLTREPMRSDGLRAVEVPPSSWHSYVVTGDHALLFEVKQGPYEARLDKVFAAWAPDEAEAGAAAAGAWLARAQPGERWSAA